MIILIERWYVGGAAKLRSFRTRNPPFSCPFPPADLVKGSEPKIRNAKMSCHVSTFLIRQQVGHFSAPRGSHPRPGTHFDPFPNSAEGILVPSGSSFNYGRFGLNIVIAGKPPRESPEHFLFAISRQYRDCMMVVADPLPPPGFTLAIIGCGE